MKSLLLKSVFVLLASTGFIACQKDSQTVTPDETVASIKAGPGPMEFTQRSSGGSIVIFSSWITKTNSDWTGQGTHEVKTSLMATSLGTDIMDSGVVLVYFEYDGKIKPLPLTWFDDSDKETLDYDFEKQKINLYLRFYDNLILEVLDLKFRYILIPGTKAGGRVKPPVDYNDYSAVCKYYGIPE